MLSFSFIVHFRCKLCAIKQQFLLLPHVFFCFCICCNSILLQIVVFILLFALICYQHIIFIHARVCSKCSMLLLPLQLLQIFALHAPINGSIRYDSNASLALQVNKHASAVISFINSWACHKSTSGICNTCAFCCGMCAFDILYAALTVVACLNIFKQKLGGYFIFLSKVTFVSWQLKFLEHF